MPNPIIDAGLALGKIAAKQAVDVGKEAFAASRHDRTPFAYEFRRAVRARVRFAINEVAEAGRYLARHPARTAVTAVSAAVSVAAYVALNRRPS